MVDVSGALQAIDAAIARLEATAGSRPEAAAMLLSLRARQRALLEELVRHLHADTERLREELHQQQQRNASLALDAARLPAVEADARRELDLLRDALRSAIEAARSEEQDPGGDPERAGRWRRCRERWEAALAPRERREP